MKRLLAALLAFALVSLAPLTLAEGVTLKTVSTFGGTDAAAPDYVAILREWEEKTGNRVEDNTATADEAWKTGVLSDFAAGNEGGIL